MSIKPVGRGKVWVGDSISSVQCPPPPPPPPPALTVQLSLISSQLIRLIRTNDDWLTRVEPELKILCDNIWIS